MYLEERAQKNQEPGSFWMLNDMINDEIRKRGKHQLKEAN